MTLRYSLLPFDGLSLSFLYDILALRAQVFVVEQASAYLDPDGYDRLAHHLCVQEDAQLIGCARILPPGSRFEEASVGRLVLASTHRGNGLGKALMQHSMQALWTLYGDVPIRIEAQHYLRDFYQSLGFTIVSDIYDWDGIPHVKMLNAATVSA